LYRSASIWLELLTPAAQGRAEKLFELLAECLELGFQTLDFAPQLNQFLLQLGHAAALLERSNRADGQFLGFEVQWNVKPG